MSNLRTTILGIVTIVAAVSDAALLYLHHQPIDWARTSALLASGWGLLHAADAKK